jgi:hypothetical protein
VTYQTPILLLCFNQEGTLNEESETRPILNKMWDLKCITAALCFLSSNVLFVVRGYLTMNSNKHAQEVMAEKNGVSVEDEDFNYEYWKLLDPTYVQYMWVQREMQRPLVIGASVRVV